jgi:ABC-type nitrate/sulfonate/bicarbonate transport system ATPase subunit
MKENRLEIYNTGDKVHKKQIEFHKNNKRIKAVFGGNRTGKTVSGAVEAVCHALGYSRFRNMKPSSGWVVSLSGDVQRKVAQAEILRWLPKKEIDERVNNIISLLGLEQFKNQYPHQLSVSTAQRIIIGRAFAMNPDLLLMDEPYGQMDVKLRFFLEDEVIRLWKKLGSTVVFITHNIEEAVYLAERVLILSNKPTTIKEEVIVDLPRPRDVVSPEFVKIRKHVTEQIKWW